MSEGNDTALMEQLVETLCRPQGSEGFKNIVTVFNEYMTSEQRDYYDLLRLVKKDGAVSAYNRLGFLTEALFPSESVLFEACRVEMSTEEIDFHPKQENSTLVSDWHVNVPQAFLETASKHKTKKKVGSLKRGYTTGACATAAALAAGRSLIQGVAETSVTITLPLGEEITFPLESCTKLGDAWSVSVRKDAGDDPDVTHLALINVTVSFSDQEGIELRGGAGVGMVTKPGLGLEVGQSAINPVPRKMILEHLGELEHDSKGLLVEISIPGGEQMAKKTLNERLGIVGGLSILGTTGIVKPFSTAAYRASIVQAIRVAIELNRTHLVLTTGGKSERFAQKIFPELPEDAFIQMGDFVGASVKSAVKNKARRLTLCGMVGKISKIANRKEMTHAAGSEVNMELLAGFAADCGASEKLCGEIKNANTARHVGELILAAELNGFYDRMCRAAAQFVYEDIAKEKLTVEVIVTDLETGDILGRYCTES